MDCQSFWADSTYTVRPLGHGFLELGNQLSDETTASITRWAQTLDFIDKAFKMEKNNQVNNGLNGPAPADNSYFGPYYSPLPTPVSDCGGVLGKRPRPLSSASSPNDYWYHAGSNSGTRGSQGVSHVIGTVENPRPSLLKRVCVQRDDHQYTQETQYEHGAQRQHEASEYNVPVSTANNDAPGSYTMGPSFYHPAQNHAANRHTASIYAAAPVFESRFPSNRAGLRPPPGFEHVVPQNHAGVPSAPGPQHVVSHGHPGIRPLPGLESAAPQNGAELRSPGVATPYNRWERNSSCTSMAAVNGDVKLRELMARFPNLNTSCLSAASDDEDRVWFTPTPVEVLRQSPKPVPWDPSRAERLAGVCGTPVSPVTSRRETPERVTMDAENRALWKTGIRRQGAVAHPSHQAARAHPHADEAHKIGVHMRQAARTYHHANEAYKIGMRTRPDVMAYHSRQAAWAYHNANEAYKTGKHCHEVSMAYHHSRKAYKDRLEREEMERKRKRKRPENDEMERQRRRLAACTLRDEFTPSEAIWGAELIRKWKQNRP